MSTLDALIGNCPHLHTVYALNCSEIRLLPGRADIVVTDNAIELTEWMPVGV